MNSVYVYMMVQVAEMIGLLDQLGGLVSEHSSYIKGYYHDYLKGAQKASLASLLPQVISTM